MYLFLEGYIFVYVLKIFRRIRFFGVRVVVLESFFIIVEVGRGGRGRGFVLVLRRVCFVKV